MDTSESKIVITGGSGFLGLKLAEHLATGGHEVVVVSRKQPAREGKWRWVSWDARSVGDWASELEGAAGVVNLAGRTVDCIKSPDHCDEILRSRVESTRAVGLALAQTKVRPPVWVQMSTAHIYGDPPDVWCDEDAAFGFGLAPIVGKAWEQALHDHLPDGVRHVLLRTSFVIGEGGGAMARLSSLARLGLGGTIGHGQQGMSWIHERDMNRLFERSLFDETMQAAYIATAPNPVSNKVFMKTLRRAIRMPIGLPAPAFGVRIAAPLLLRTDPELALYGRYCVSRRLKEAGFEFEFPEVGDALKDLYG